MDLFMLVLYGICATIVSIPTGAMILLPMLLFRAMFVWPWMRNKLLEQAIRKGNVVKATYVEETGYSLQGESGVHPGGSSTARYEYEYQGKKYTKRLTTTRSNFPMEIELYFVKNPNRACVSNEIGLSEPNWLAWYLLSFGIAWIAIVLIGVLYVNPMLG